MYKVYVGCLPASCTSEQLAAFFSRFGPIEDTKVTRKAGSKLCSGNGTFGCKDRSTYDQIISVREFDFYGRNIFCEGKLSGGELLLKNQSLSRRRIFVSNLPSDATDQDIEDAMRVFGPVQNGYRIKTLNNKPRPFGFVTFLEESAAEKAVEVGFILLNNQFVYISPFKKNTSRQEGTEGPAILETGNGITIPNHPPSLSKIPFITSQAKTGSWPTTEGYSKPASAKVGTHIKPTSVSYHQGWQGLDHGAAKVRFNIQYFELPPTHPVVSKQVNQTHTTHQQHHLLIS